MAPGSSTRATHPPRPRVDGAAPLTPPIFETTTFRFASAAALRRYLANEGGYLYSRYENPTVLTVEAALANLDGADAGLAFGSGMAAISTTLLALARAGDEVVCSAGVYGGTSRFVADVLPRLGIDVRFVDLLREGAGDVLGPRTRALVFESPMNPHLRVVDVAAVAGACRSADVVSVLDNTFATAINQPPFALGVDLALQSGSKYLGGHSDVTAGVVTGSAERLAPIERMRRALGGILDPQPAYLLDRSLRTLPTRIARHNATALAVAAALEGHPAVERVLYPGLPSHPEHALAARQMRGFGGMVTIDLRGGEAAAERAFDRLEVVERAASLGSVESLCSLPILTSHWGCDAAQLEAAGVTAGMLRFSIGLEDPEDLIADITRAIA